MFSQYLRNSVFFILVLFVASCDTFNQEKFLKKQVSESVDRSGFDENKTMLTLSSIILTTSGLDPHFQDTIVAYLKRKELATKGDWELVWFAEGTSVINDKTTACIVKHKYLKNTLAIVNQGSDLKSIEEWYSELDIFKTEEYPYASFGNDYRIAKGFKILLDSFDSLESFSDLFPEQKISAFEYLEAYCKDRKGEKVHLYLTGHSLGGLLTTGIAPRCKQILEKYVAGESEISSWTYAEPSLYNQGFVDYFRDLMSSSHVKFYYQRYFLANDQIPTRYAWDIQNIGKLNYPTSWFLYYRLRFLAHLISGILRLHGTEYAELGCSNDSFVHKVKNKASRSYFNVPDKLYYFKDMDAYVAWNHDHKSYMFSLDVKCIPITSKSDKCPFPEF